MNRRGAKGGSTPSEEGKGAKIDLVKGMTGWPDEDISRVLEKYKGDAQLAINSILDGDEGVPGEWEKVESKRTKADHNKAPKAPKQYRQQRPLQGQGNQQSHGQYTGSSPKSQERADQRQQGQPQSSGRIRVQLKEKETQRERVQEGGASSPASQPHPVEKENGTSNGAAVQQQGGLGSIQSAERGRSAVAQATPSGVPTTPLKYSTIVSQNLPKNPPQAQNLPQHPPQNLPQNSTQTPTQNPSQTLATSVETLERRVDKLEVKEYQEIAQSQSSPQQAQKQKQAPIASPGAAANATRQYHPPMAWKPKDATPQKKIGGTPDQGHPQSQLPQPTERVSSPVAVTPKVSSAAVILPSSLSTSNIDLQFGSFAIPSSYEDGKDNTKPFNQSVQSVRSVPQKEQMQQERQRSEIKSREQRAQEESQIQEQEYGMGASEGDAQQQINSAHYSYLHHGSHMMPSFPPHFSPFDGSDSRAAPMQMYDPSASFQQPYRNPSDPNALNEALADSSKGYTNQRTDSLEQGYPESKYQQSVDGSTQQQPPYAYSSYVYANPYMQYPYRNAHPQQQYYPNLATPRYYNPNAAYPGYTTNTTGYPQSSAASIPVSGGYSEEMVQDYKNMYSTPFFHPGLAAQDMSKGSHQDMSSNVQQQNESGVSKPPSVSLSSDLQMQNGQSQYKGQQAYQPRNDAPTSYYMQYQQQQYGQTQQYGQRESSGQQSYPRNPQGQPRKL